MIPRLATPDWRQVRTTLLLGGEDKKDPGTQRGGCGSAGRPARGAGRAMCLHVTHAALPRLCPDMCSNVLPCLQPYVAGGR